MIIDDLEKGDIMVRYEAGGQSHDYLTHAAIFIRHEDKEALKWNPFISDITGDGFKVRHLGTTDRKYNRQWSCYRLSLEKTVRVIVAGLTYRWVTSINCIKRFEEFTVSSVYDRPSIITSFFGRSMYGNQARQYAKYLHENCWSQAPAVLTEGGQHWFSGVICSYLPIALYQTVLGPSRSEQYMALDCRKTLPRDMVRYFNTNPYWEVLGKLEL